MIEVVRRKEAPASLAAGLKYDGLDVKEALLEDFLAKCYLCEGPLTIGAMEVDHRVPLNEGGAKFDWENLFPACHDCNLRRWRTARAGGWLAPGRGDQVDLRISQRCLGPREIQFVAISGTDLPARSLADELDHIHNAPDSAKASDLRNAIGDQLFAALVVMTEMAFETRDAEPSPATLWKFRRLTSRAAPYAALVRSMVHPELHPWLEPLTP